MLANFKGGVNAVVVWKLLADWHHKFCIGEESNGCSYLRIPGVLCLEDEAELVL